LFKDTRSEKEINSLQRRDVALVRCSWNQFSQEKFQIPFNKALMPAEKALGGKRWSGRSWKDKFSSSLTRKAVAPLSLSIKCLVLLRISFRIFASVSENRILICAFKCSSATGLRGRIEEEDETKTEKASDRTISEAWYKREPICSSSRTIVGADFLDGFCNWIVSI
jgi:hypothetical protein